MKKDIICVILFAVGAIGFGMVILLKYMHNENALLMCLWFLICWAWLLRCINKIRKKKKSKSEQVTE